MAEPAKARSGAGINKAAGEGGSTKSPNISREISRSLIRENSFFHPRKETRQLSRESGRLFCVEGLFGKETEKSGSATPLSGPQAM